VYIMTICCRILRRPFPRKNPLNHVISGSRRGVNEIYALLGCYAAQIGGYRRFGTIYPSEQSVTATLLCFTSQKSEDLLLWIYYMLRFELSACWIRCYVLRLIQTFRRKLMISSSGHFTSWYWTQWDFLKVFFTLNMILTCLFQLFV
jgi:hypothetical protein